MLYNKVSQRNFNFCTEGYKTGSSLGQLNEFGGLGENFKWDFLLYLIINIIILI